MGEGSLCDPQGLLVSVLGNDLKAWGLVSRYPGGLKGLVANCLGNDDFIAELGMLSGKIINRLCWFVAMLPFDRSFRRLMLERISSDASSEQEWYWYLIGLLDKDDLAARVAFPSTRRGVSGFLAGLCDGARSSSSLLRLVAELREIGFSFRIMEYSLLHREAILKYGDYYRAALDAISGGYDRAHHIAKVLSWALPPISVEVLRKSSRHSFFDDSAVPENVRKGWGLYLELCEEFPALNNAEELIRAKNGDLSDVEVCDLFRSGNINTHAVFLILMKSIRPSTFWALLSLSQEIEIQSRSSGDRELTLQGGATIVMQPASLVYLFAIVAKWACSLVSGDSALNFLRALEGEADVGLYSLKSCLLMALLSSRRMSSLQLSKLEMDDDVRFFFSQFSIRASRRSSGIFTGHIPIPHQMGWLDIRFTCPFYCEPYIRIEQEKKLRFGI